MHAESTTIENIHSTAYGMVSSDDGHTLKKGNFSAGKVYVSSDKNSQNQVYWPVEVQMFNVKITAVAYNSWSLYFYPRFKVYISNLGKDSDSTEIKDLRQDTGSHSAAVGGHSPTIEKRTQVAEGKYIKIIDEKDCDSITGASLGIWFKVTSDLNITIKNMD